MRVPFSEIQKVELWRILGCDNEVLVCLEVVGVSD